MSASVAEPTAAAATRAIQTGDVGQLRGLLAEHAGLARVRIDRGSHTITLLHVATDWPGYFPHAPEAARVLIEFGADVNAATEGGGNAETPLHWAASSDDLEVAEALLELGAHLDVDGGSIGTPLDNAVGYGCWHVARLLAAHGATVKGIWQAAALGLTPRVQKFLDADPPPSADELNHAFWQACHGGQRRTAELLRACGADLNATPEHSELTPLEITTSTDTRRDTMADWLRQRGARSRPT